MPDNISICYINTVSQISTNVVISCTTWEFPWLETLLNNLLCFRKCWQVLLVLPPVINTSHKVKQNLDLSKGTELVSFPTWSKVTTVLRNWSFALFENKSPEKNLCDSDHTLWLRKCIHLCVMVKWNMSLSVSGCLQRPVLSWKSNGLLIISPFLFLSSLVGKRMSIKFKPKEAKRGEQCYKLSFPKFSLYSQMKLIGILGQSM